MVSFLLVTVVAFQGSEAFLRKNIFPSTVPANVFANHNIVANNSGALFLTPYIKAGKIEEAQALSEVKLDGAPQIKSFSGFLTVNEKTDSNMFFWFFPAKVSF